MKFKIYKRKGEVKMRKILIGAVRSKGDFKEGKRKIKYDNIKLYLADYRDFKCHGFSFDKNFEPIKVKTVDFEEVTGISVKEFLCNFEKEFMFHKVRVISEENDFGRDEVIELKISEKTCFVLHRELEAKKKLEVEDFDEDEEDDSEDEFEDLDDESDDDDLDGPEDDFDFDLDKETGEVSVKKAKKGDAK